MPAAVRLAWKVGFDAFWHFSEDDGWAMASHVALSALLAIFPFLIFGATLASFLGADEFSETAVHLIFDNLPALIAEPISKEVVQVLTIPRGGLLTISVLAAFYFASNGVEALRISMNRAYRVYDPRRWYITRMISLGYVLAAVMALVLLSAFLVAAPLAVHFAGRFIPIASDLMTLIDNWSVWGALATILIVLFVAHLFLPAGKRSFLDVLPGIVLTIIAWYAAAQVFGYYLSTFANYAATYAGLASIMIALVFLYMLGVILMLGAEINAALMKYRVRRLIKRSISGSPTSEPDPAADV
ncbi:MULTISPECIES: YihY/virulence factor BrkB family protein [unclassified Rhizobium]|uniref:YihY/virulence factor BrkB family protein n=1 Tax=unclassified Rhizobium TaxID=2613769 RepID=UPI00160071C7|nr:MULTISPECIES: YihY/virulence factor BrkB family protein [unclassified Rhizobium]MBB1249311.1 YihY/virulence factor BrkB family protein [Rhizobium sp. G21]MCV3768348.1 YihY/virulence factor BrkB family protein [Rhizobium sp. TRM95796]